MQSDIHAEGRFCDNSQDESYPEVEDEFEDSTAGTRKFTVTSNYLKFALSFHLPFCRYSTCWGASCPCRTTALDL